MSLSWEGWVTIVVLVVGLVIMAMDKIPPDFVFMGMLGILLTCQIITLGEGLSGFSNSGLATVMVLFPVAEGISKTGGLDSLFSMLLGKPTSLASAQIRMMIPVSLLSAFLNNTPIVALLVPLIFHWAKSGDTVHAQKLLIPLSFASIFGGTCTLIGTSTNLVVAGLQADRAKLDPSIPFFGMFDITAYGFPYAVFGIVYVVVFSPWLLPPMQQWGRYAKLPEADEEELLVGLQVEKYSPVVGKTIEAAGLRSLDKVYLTSVERGGYPIPAVGPDFELHALDVLFFSGDLKGVKALTSSHGLMYVTNETEDFDFTSMLGSPTIKSPRASTVARTSMDAATYLGNSNTLYVGSPPHEPSPTRPPKQVKQTSVNTPALKAEASHTVTFKEQASAGSVPSIPTGVKGFPLVQKSAPSPGEAMIAPDVASTSSSFAMEDCTSANADADRRSHGEITEVEVDFVHRKKPFSPSNLALKEVKITGLPDGLECSDMQDSTMKTAKNKVTQLLRVRVSSTSEMIGRSIRQIGFRSKLSASVVAVIRNNLRVPGKLGDVILEAGDLLLLDAPETFDRYSELVRSNFDSIEFVEDEGRGFMAPMVVMDGSILVGKTIQAAELRGLPGLFLVAIDRISGETLHAVDPATVLEAGDVLWFSGDLEAITSLRKVAGLVHQEDRQAQKIGIAAIHRRLVQAVVASSSPLVGKTVRKYGFRTHFGAAIIAIHRQGERLRCKIGDAVLKAGDVLLLDTGAGFVGKYMYDRTFALLAEVENSTPTNTSRMLVAGLLGLAMVLSQIIGAVTGPFIDLFTAALLAAAGMLATGCLTGDQARRSINWGIFLTIGSAFGVSIAMENTGVASLIATFLVQVGTAIGGKVALLVCVYIATSFLSNFIANNAAAAIMFPISFQVAGQLGIDYNIMSITLMLGASSCYAMPFGYQTNLMVFGAGGYRTMDFIRFGGPLQLWLVFAFALIVWLAVAGNLWIIIALAAVATICLAVYPFAIAPLTNCISRSCRGKSLSSSK